MLNNNAINFTHLLLEYYKELGLNEKELAVLLMIEHVNNNDSILVTTSTLSLKMSLPADEIDDIMNNLYIRGYIDIHTGCNGGSSTSLEPIKDKVYSLFSKDVIRDTNMMNDKEMEDTRTEVLRLLEKTFDRSLTPLEIDRVDDWVSSGTPKNIIINSIKDAKLRHITSVNQIDKIILFKLREQDNYGNDIAK